MFQERAVSLSLQFFFVSITICLREPSFLPARVFVFMSAYVGVNVFTSLCVCMFCLCVCSFSCLNRRFLPMLL